MRNFPKQVVDLPFPVSVNQIWRKGRSRATGKQVFYRSKKYMDWRKHADALYLIQPLLHTHLIDQPFECIIIYSPPDKRKRDLDNLQKVVLDWAKHAGIILDDSLCVSLRSYFGEPEEAPEGCRLIVRPARKRPPGST